MSVNNPTFFLTHTHNRTEQITKYAMTTLFKHISLHLKQPLSRNVMTDVHRLTVSGYVTTRLMLVNVLLHKMHTFDTSDLATGGSSSSPVLQTIISKSGLQSCHFFVPSHSQMFSQALKIHGWDYTFFY